MFDYEDVKRYYFEKGHADHAGKGRFETSGEGNARLLDLLPAAEAVIDRWDSPAWKDVPRCFGCEGERLNSQAGGLFRPSGGMTCWARFLR